MNPRQVIVFVCEHGAAKSIVAAAYFNRFAEEIGLNWLAIARGASPQDELSSRAIKGLGKDGLTPTESKPQKLALADVQLAQRVVTFCELPAEYQQKIIIERRHDIPLLNENYEVARDAIVKHICYLMNQLSDDASQK